jgi:hypothetical protein
MGKARLVVGSQKGPQAEGEGYREGRGQEGGRRHGRHRDPHLKLCKLVQGIYHSPALKSFQEALRQIVSLTLGPTLPLNSSSWLLRQQEKVWEEAVLPWRKVPPVRSTALTSGLHLALNMARSEASPASQALPDVIPRFQAAQGSAAFVLHSGSPENVRADVQRGFQLGTQEL